MTIVFDFSWVLQSSKQIEDNCYAFFGGEGGGVVSKVLYDLRENGE